MSPWPLPSKLLIGVLIALAMLALAGLIEGATVLRVWYLAAIAATGLLILSTLDGWLTLRSWRAAPLTLRRQLPAAFAIGVQRAITVEIANAGNRTWRGQFFEGLDPRIECDGMPLEFELDAGHVRRLGFTLTPTQRGAMSFAMAELRLGSCWGLLEFCARVGELQERRVYPNFAAVARYAWLAGDRRLSEIGIKAYRQRGEGTDFKQLAEYQPGDPIRHIDWKATLKFQRPIVREFQDERDQCVLFLLDCGRRMRADDRTGAAGAAHFDQVLNATMLLSYVALKQGDAVGVMTFGTPPGNERLFAPRKGASALNAMMASLSEVQPSATHSDFAVAARELMRRHHKRSLVVILTNFRDEDAAELAPALALLRSRHLVLLASIRERIVQALIEQPLGAPNRELEVAAAHHFDQARRDAFQRLASRDALLVDVEPQRLGIELVNRYNAVKRAGLI
jgi:uncharacterized protein (DUF58 family)